MESDNSYIVLKNNMDGLRIILGLVAELDDSMIARLKATNKQVACFLVLQRYFKNDELYQIA